MRYVAEIPNENRIVWFWTQQGAIDFAKTQTGPVRVLRIGKRSRIVWERL